MAADPLQPQRLRDLATDLAVERRRLEALIESLAGLAERWQREGADAERVDAAALRLQSFYTGVERCLLQVVRVLNGGTPEGADWHRRLLDRLTLATEHRPALLSSDTARALGLLLGFRHVVRHLYADDLDPAQVQQRLSGALMLWPQLCADLQAFDHWLQELIALAESDHSSG
ncbi:MAG: hypothetical protein ACK55X_13975 [Synechococcaceae cyanobacterium]